MSRKKLLLRSWTLWLTLLVLAVVVFPLAESQEPERAAARIVGGAEVHGSVVASLDLAASQGKAGDLYLPDITVYLKKIENGKKSPAVKTLRNGFYAVPTQPAGRYQLCVEAAGYTPSCATQVTIAGRTVYLPPVRITPKRGFIVGRVRMKDGAVCAFEDQVFGVRIDALVRATPAGGAKVPAVRANNTGRFLLPGVPLGGVNVVARCEGASAQQSLSLASGVAVANLSLPNVAPGAVTVTAQSAGKGVRLVAPGTTVTVAAEARDDQPLKFSWDVSDGTLSARTGRSVDWTLPARPGIYSIYVLAQDGQGGVTRSRRDISTHKGVFFTGTVVAGSGVGAVRDAAVEVNGQTARTNAAGLFSLSVPGDASRYVLTIRKEGFQILSKVFDAPVIGRTYRLIEAEKFVFEAGEGIRMTEREGCQRRRASADRQGKEGRPLGVSPCGAEVIIPPGALVDGRGNPVTGRVNGYVASIDLRDPEGGFPGEYAGVRRGGDEVGLNSLGAVDVQLTDATGQPLNLASGSTAVVRIPADPLQLGMPGMPSSPPATVPIWFYDPRSGIWKQEGEAQLHGSFYEAKVKHFSTINADLEFTNPACVRVITDTARLQLPYQLRVSVPANAPVKVKTETIADALSVIVRLPPNTPIKLEALDSQGHVIQTATKTHNTGATSSPAFPLYSYVECTSEVTMTVDVPSDGGLLEFVGLSTAAEADEYYARIDPVATAGGGTIASSGTAVTGTGTSFLAFFKAGHLLRPNAGAPRLITQVISNTQLTVESAFAPDVPAGTAYEKVGAKPTLDDWKAANGFVGPPDQDAIYLNAADLGLGRWMNMKKKVNGDIAYYVSNYGVPPAFGSADIAALAKLNGDPSLGLIATVAMEYTAKPGDPVTSRYTKFYVYNKDGNRVNKADLDGVGNKYIPKLCVICHAGNGTPSGDAKGDLQAKFIPFDPESFGYSGLPGFSRTDQETQFKELNRGVRDNTNVTAAVQELINGWYGGPALPLTTHQSSFVPPRWTAPVDKSSLYSQVVKTSCRSCHTTRDDPLSWAAWDDPNPFDGFKEYGGTIYYRVCDSREMPNAKVTFRNFWLSSSPHQPAALGNGGLDSWAPADLCPVP
ncbi:MAG TPA: PKD domain-containing protein [Thermoanaerobaculia bacterium]|nr:PKD domain-containing protein [Thermoanaerobaculia bacterium]